MATTDQPMQVNDLYLGEPVLTDEQWNMCGLRAVVAGLSSTHAKHADKYTRHELAPDERAAFSAMLDAAISVLMGIRAQLTN